MLTRFRAAFVVLALTCTATIVKADVVLTWNELMVKTLVTQGQNPFAQARLASIVQLAVFEAINSITGEYEPYVAIPPAPGASLDAAAATAAYRVLKTYFPAAPDIDQAYTDALAAIPAGAAKTDGVAAGEAAAAAMIANRTGDGSTPVTIAPLALPLAGVWQLTSPPGCAVTATGGALYNWKDVKPFGVPDVAAFRSVPPPLLTSSEFTKDYNEVKRVGDVDSTERTLDRATAPGSRRRRRPSFSIRREQVAAAENRSISDNARALALLNMATSDSLVASFATKYHYNFWRPENAIRFLGDYGNPQTPPDPTYVPFISTPCFPSYPSNHASGSNGAAEILRRVYGEGGHAITITNPFNPAVASLTFTYTTFNQMAADIDDARVYGGIHFRFDQVAGNVLGRAVATYVYKHNLRKVQGN